MLKEKMTPSLKVLGRRGIFQHDNNHKHKAFKDWKKKTWQSLSLDLNPIENLWSNLKLKVGQ